MRIFTEHEGTKLVEDIAFAASEGVGHVEGRNVRCIAAASQGHHTEIRNGWTFPVDTAIQEIRKKPRIPRAVFKKRAVIGVLSAWLIIYLCFVFCIWNWDVSRWSADQRFGIILVEFIIGVAMGIVARLTYSDYYEDPIQSEK